MFIGHVYIVIMLYVSIIESLYLSYTYHFLQTSVDFNILDSPTNIFFKHAIGNMKMGRICPFGQYAIVMLILLLLARNFMLIPEKAIMGAILLALVLSLINMNAFVYLLPVIFVEALNYMSLE